VIGDGSRHCPANGFWESSLMGLCTVQPAAKISAAPSPGQTTAAVLGIHFRALETCELLTPVWDSEPRGSVSFLSRLDNNNSAPCSRLFLPALLRVSFALASTTSEGVSLPEYSYPTSLPSQY
jgi:hypothetical protein